MDSKTRQIRHLLKLRKFHGLQYVFYENRTDLKFNGFKLDSYL
jgi:hypothetical protein